MPRAAPHNETNVGLIVARSTRLTLRSFVSGHAHRARLRGRVAPAICASDACRADRRAPRPA
ncbi:hypothetical protein BW685_24710 [Burkholderia ubonensis]|uniref:Uncharacterized protein n=1 Tax=Burkholderia ubonensis TaxID=101571 RepID=A0A1R1J697_9BURK|nr:hypothetical protein BW685_24710 [Burkholderia ubonensis]